MPLETRRIILSDTELHLAADQYREANPHLFPQGKLTSCSATDQGMDLIFRSRDAARKIRHRHVSRAEAVRILIHFCLDHKIPLPRQGDKTLYLDGAKACLEIKLLTDLQSLAAKQLSAVQQAT